MGLILNEQARGYADEGTGCAVSARSLTIAGGPALGASADRHRRLRRGGGSLGGGPVHCEVGPRHGSGLGAVDGKAAAGRHLMWRLVPQLRTPSVEYGKVYSIGSWLQDITIQGFDTYHKL